MSTDGAGAAGAAAGAAALARMADQPHSKHATTVWTVPLRSVIRMLDVRDLHRAHCLSAGLLDSFFDSRNARYIPKRTENTVARMPATNPTVNCAFGVSDNVTVVGICAPQRESGDGLPSQPHAHARETQEHGIVPSFEGSRVTPRTSANRGDRRWSCFESR